MTLRFIALWWVFVLLAYSLNLFSIYPEQPNHTQLIYFILVQSFGLVLVSYLRMPKGVGVIVKHTHARLYFVGSLLVSVAVLPLSVSAYTGANLSDLPALMFNPQDAYFNLQNTVSDNRSERAGLLLVKFITSWLLVALIPLALLLYTNKKIGSTLLILAILVPLIMSVFRGTDKEIVDIAIFLVGVSLLGRINAPTPFALRAYFLKIIFSKWTLLLVPLTLISFIVFWFRKSSRLGGVVEHCIQNTDACISNQSAISFPFAMLYRYVTHGMNGLAVSFDAISNPCPLVGSSRTVEYLAQFLDIYCDNKITDQLTQLGWTSRGAWSTGFVELANNFGHNFVIIQIFIFAIILKYSGNIYKEEGCYLSGVVFLLNFHILFYMIANLNIFQSGESFAGYVILNFWFVVMQFKRIFAGGRQY